MYPLTHPTEYVSTLRRLSRELRARAADGSAAMVPYSSHADALDNIAFDLLLIDAEQTDR